MGWLAGILFVLMMVTVALQLEWKRGSIPIPTPDLAALDAPVARLIRQKIKEVQAEPGSGKAWGKLGSVLWAYDFPEPARECLAQAERLDPREPRWPYLRSFLLEVDRPAEALASLRRAVQLCGSVPETPRLRLALLLAEDGKWDEAGMEIERLLQADPNFSPALVLEARRRQSAGELSEAIQLADRCAHDPRTARAAAILLAGLHGRAGNTIEAGNATRRISALPPDKPLFDPYQNEVAQLRNDPRVLTQQTHPLLASGRLEEAWTLIEQLLEEHPAHAETWLVAGRYHLLKKDLSSAEQTLRRHLELDPRSSQGWFQLGLAQLAREKFVEAAHTFFKATELKPDFGPAYYNRGFALLRGGDPRQAAPAFRQAIRLNPERIDSYLMLAGIALHLKDGSEAASWLHQAEALDPNHPGVRQIRGSIPKPPGISSSER